MPQPASAYDEIAGMYHALWADWYLPAAAPALEKLFFSSVSPGARVLDLCCGSGHVTKELVRRGYQVTGIDSSAELIALARKDLPGVDFQVLDARELKFEKRFEGVLSTFDSLNHIMSIEELRDVFGRVHRALKRGGLFAFDMNLEQAYTIALRQWTADVSDDSVGLVRGTFDRDTGKAATELIWFTPASDGLWVRRHSIVEEKCYSQSEILLGLSDAGFKNIEAVAGRDAGMRPDLALGRVFFVATR